MLFCVFFFKQKTAYEMRISDWSSDVCSSDLDVGRTGREHIAQVQHHHAIAVRHHEGHVMLHEQTRAAGLAAYLLDHLAKTRRLELTQARARLVEQHARKSVVSGTSVLGRVDFGWRR